jgi:DNA-binding NtrC family response regulator
VHRPLGVIERGWLVGQAGQVWIVEDEPAAAALAADLCESAGAPARVFRMPSAFVAALRTSPPPGAVVLDWRLEHELSAALFLATRHRYPRLPVIYWTASDRSVLPSMICDDRATMIVDKAAGMASFEAALTWALSAPALPQLFVPGEDQRGIHAAESERG